MCEKPMGVFGGLALGCLFRGHRKGATVTETRGTEGHRPWRHPAFVFLAVPLFTAIVLTAAAGAPWWLLLVFAAAALALAGAGFALMRALHGAVASPALTARLAGRPALPRAMQRRLEQPWRVVSVQRVQDSPAAIQGRVLTAPAKIKP